MFRGLFNITNMPILQMTNSNMDHVLASVFRSFPGPTQYSAHNPNNEKAH